MKKLIVIVCLLTMSSLSYSQSGSKSYPSRIVEEPKYPNRVTAGDSAVTQISSLQVRKLNILKIEFDACEDEVAKLTTALDKSGSIFEGLKKENELYRKLNTTADGINEKYKEKIIILENNTKTLQSRNHKLDLKSKFLVIVVGVLATSTGILLIAK